MSKTNFEELSERKMKASEIECRPKVSLSGKTAKVLLYMKGKTPRDILNEVIGIANWQCRHYQVKNKDFAEISVKNSATGEWISKSDCGDADKFSFDRGKAESTDAMKRAAMLWGVGSELQSAPKIQFQMSEDEVREFSFNSEYETDENGNPKVVTCFIINEDSMVRFEVKEIESDNAKNITHLVVDKIKGNIVVDTFVFDSQKKVEANRDYLKIKENQEAKNREESMKKTLIGILNKLEVNWNKLLEYFKTDKVSELTLVQLEEARAMKEKELVLVTKPVEKKQESVSSVSSIVQNAQAKNSTGKAQAFLKSLGIPA